MNNKEIVKDFASLKDMAKKAGEGIKNALGKGPSLDGLKRQIKEQSTIINQGQKQLLAYQKRLNDINAEKPVKAIQKAMDSQAQSIEKAKVKLAEYQAKMDQMEAKRATIETGALDTAKLGGEGIFSDSPKDLNKRKNTILADDKEYQGIIDKEIEMSQKMETYQIKINSAQESVSKLASELERTKATQINTLNQNIEETSGVVDKARSKLHQLTFTFAKLKEKMNLSKSTKKTDKALNTTSESAKVLGKNVTNGANKGIKSLTRFGLAVFSVRSAYAFARRAASEYLQTNEQLSNQVSGIWNTIAQAIGPVVQQIVSWIVTLVSYINALIKAFTGIDFVANANAKAFDKQAKSAEKAKRSMAGFDEMEVLNKDDSGDSGGGSTPQLQLDPVNIDGIKAKLLELFEPLKKAWANYGKGFVDSFKYALGEIGELIKSIGKSFGEVWTNGTGQKTVELILQIFTNIFNIIGQIAQKFREAWDAGGTGTAIIQALWDGLNNCLEVIKLILDFILNLVEQVDFTPFLKGVLGISKAFKEITAYAKDFVKNIIEAIKSGDWSGVGSLIAQAFNDAFSSVNDLITSIDWLELGFKIGSTFYSGLIAFWDMVINFFTTLDWTLIGETITNVVSSLITLAFGIIEGVDYVELGLKIADAIFSGISAIVELLFSIDWFGLLLQIGQLCVEGIFMGLVELGSIVIELFRKMLEAVLEFLGIHSPSTVFRDIGINILAGIQEGIAGLGEFLVGIFRDAYNGIVKIFSGIGNFFGGLWNIIKDKFSGLGTAIGDAIGNAVKSGINGVITLVENTINNAINLINGAIGIINLLPGVNVGKIPVLNIPRLAKGGIINNPGPGVNMGSYIGGEKGPEAVVPLTDSQFIKDFALEVAKYLGGNQNDQPTTIILKVGEKEFYKWFINMKKKYEFVTNGG